MNTIFVTSLGYFPARSALPAAFLGPCNRAGSLYKRLAGMLARSLGRTSDRPSAKGMESSPPVAMPNSAVWMVSVLTPTPRTEYPENLPRAAARFAVRKAATPELPVPPA